jgi:hypothetical protein
MSIHTNIAKFSSTFLANKDHLDILNQENIAKVFAPELAFLKNYYNQNKSKILELCKQSIDGNKDYRVIALVDDIICKIVLRIKKSTENGFLLQLGYPFEFMSVNLEGMNFENYEVRICLGGEKLRKAQRVFLQHFLKCKAQVVEEKNDFREHIKQLFFKADNVIYVDPYTFIGDSVIGIYILEQFEKNFSFKTSAFFSRAHAHLKQHRINTYPVDSEIINSKITKNTLIIAPDLIDTHFVTIVELLSEIKKPVSLLIVGRNLTAETGKQNKITWYESPDQILWDSNVESYLNDCLEPFFLPTNEIQKLDFNMDKSKPVLIAPFASLPEKTFSDTLLKSILKLLDEKGFRKVVISCGNTNEVDKKNAVKGIISRMKFSNISVSLELFDDLSELSRLIVNEDVLFGISADTAISPLLYSLNRMVFTIFIRSWDKDNIRSLAGESPLGFCRFGCCQMPLILADDFSPLEGIFIVLDSLSSKNIRINKFASLVEKSNQNITIKEYEELCNTYRKLCACIDPSSRLLKMYDPSEFFESLVRLDLGKTHKLVYSSFKISPLLKLIESASNYS